MSNVPYSGQPGAPAAGNPIKSYGRRAGWLNSLLVADFSGGLNLRDAPTELAENESQDCMNITLDENGGLMKRLGLTRLNTGGAMPGVASNEYYSPSLQVTILQIGATLYKTADFITFTAFKTLSTSNIATFTDFQGQLVYCHQDDGVFTYDGTTNTNRSATIKGTCIASWQNKVFVAGDPAKPSLVTCSATGDATGWTVGAAGCAQNQLREKDDTVITALGVGQGEDISGRPGLLAFKGESAYRINDSATLAYTTVDGSAGAAGPFAVQTLGGVTVTFCKKGMFTIDPGGTTDMKSVADKLQPLFNSSQMNFAKLNLVAGGTYRDRVVFSLPFGPAATVNTLTLEFHPVQGWIVPHDFGMAAFTTFGKNDALLYGISPTLTNAYSVFTNWSDDGAAIACRYRTREIQPAEGFQCNFRRLRLFGRGIFDLYTLFDMTQGQGDLSSVDLTGTGFTWNDVSATWNDPGMVWGPTSYEVIEDFWSLGVARSVSFMLRESSTTAATGPKLLTTGVAPQLGSVAVYQMLVEYIQLGYS